MLTLLIQKHVRKVIDFLSLRCVKNYYHEYHLSSLVHSKKHPRKIRRNLGVSFMERSFRKRKLFKMLRKLSFELL